MIYCKNLPALMMLQLLLLEKSDHGINLWGVTKSEAIRRMENEKLK